MQSSFARFNDRQGLALEVESNSAVRTGNQMISIAIWNKKSEIALAEAARAT